MLPGRHGVQPGAQRGPAHPRLAPDLPGVVPGEDGQGKEGVLGDGEYFCSARPPVYPLLLQHCHLLMLPQGWKSHRDHVSQQNPAHTETIAVTEVKNKLCSRREEEV